MVDHKNKVSFHSYTVVCTTAVQPLFLSFFAFSSLFFQITDGTKSGNEVINSAPHFCRFEMFLTFPRISFPSWFGKFVVLSRFAVYCEILKLI